MSGRCGFSPAAQVIPAAGRDGRALTGTSWASAGTWSTSSLVVEQRDQRDQRADPGQRAVVAAAAAAEPVPGPVDGQRGHQHHVGPGHRVDAARRLARLQQPARPGDQRVRALIGRPVQVAVRPQQRQQRRRCPASTARTPGRGCPARCPPSNRPRPSRPSAARAASAGRPGSARPAAAPLAPRARAGPGRPSNLWRSATLLFFNTWARHVTVPAQPGTRPSREFASVHGMADKDVTKAVIPAAGPGHQVPARDQGDAQGNAAGRRQAGHPVRRGGGRRGRAWTTC